MKSIFFFVLSVLLLAPTGANAAVSDFFKNPQKYVCSEATESARERENFWQATRATHVANLKASEKFRKSNPGSIPEVISKSSLGIKPNEDKISVKADVQDVNASYEFYKEYSKLLETSVTQGKKVTPFLETIRRAQIEAVNRFPISAEDKAKFIKEIKKTRFLNFGEYFEFFQKPFGKLVPLFNGQAFPLSNKKAIQTIVRFVEVCGPAGQMRGGRNQTEVFSAQATYASGKKETIEDEARIALICPAVIRSMMKLAQAGVSWTFHPTVAHELGHSIDADENVKTFGKFRKCIKKLSQKEVGNFWKPGTRRNAARFSTIVNEVSADLIAAETLAVMAQGKPEKEVEMVLKESLVDKCDNWNGENMSGKLRIEFFSKNPSLRKALNAPKVGTDEFTCDLSGEVNL